MMAASVDDLPGARWPCDQHDAVLQSGDISQALWQLQLTSNGDPGDAMTRMTMA